jgi:CheY-like chemotaxis protein
LTTTPEPIDQPVGPDRVLYIEDNPVNSTLMEAMLDVLPGVQLLCADTAAQGLAMAERERPRLILLDIQMPDLDGFEVLARLRTNPATQAIPVIAVTGQAGPQDIARGRHAGFAAYLAKPLHLHALLQAVCDALGRPLPGTLQRR